MADAVDELGFSPKLREFLAGLAPAELAYLDGLTAGTVTASKALVADANKDLASLRNLTVTGPITYDHNTGITAFATGGQASATALTGEYNNVTVCATAGDSVKLLTAVAGQTQTVKNNGAAALDVFPNTSDAINGLSANTAYSLPVGAEVTFRAIDAATWHTQAAANIREIAKLSGAPFTVTTASTTPASGSCAAQFVVKDADGVAVTVPVSLEAYLTASATGLTHDAAGTSIAVLTNGALTVEDATALVGPFFRITTTAAGLIGLTLTSGAGTYYIAFILPNGKLAMSSAIVVN